MTVREPPLAQVFPKANEDSWRDAALRALKGGAFEKLVSKTYDGLALAPLYSRAEKSGPRALRRQPGRWAILARVDHDGDGAANRLAIEDLEGGADGLHLVFAGAQGAYGAGLAGDDAETIAHVLDNVRLEWGVPTVVETSPRAPNAAASIMRLLDSRHIDPKAARVGLGYDPLGAMALHGFLDAPWKESGKRLAANAKSAAQAGFGAGTIVADARVVNAAGGTEAQELGFLLAAAAAYLRALADNGIDIETARGLLSLRLAADADELMGVAKFRAARRLYARLEEACGLAPASVLLHGETAWRMMTRRDPYNNILRATLASFAAAVGGADMITALPFTQAIGAPDAFARRLARDTQLVLQDESYLHVVDDPASGAGGFESLTEELCRLAWGVFQDIEAQGGLARSLESGAFQASVADIERERAKNVARGKDKLTGVNEFPNLFEAPLAVLAPPDPERSQTVAPAGAVHGPRLAPLRLAEPFEALRDRSDAIVAKTGLRPILFLATPGSVAAFTPRANFAKNFFEAGGIETIAGPAGGDLAATVKAFQDSGAKAACICSADAVYCDAAEPLAAALSRAGAAVYLAGRPGELQQKLRQAGVAGFVFSGCDMLGVLQRAFEVTT